MANNEYLKSYCAVSTEYEVNNALEFLVKNGIIQPTPDGLKTTEFGMLIAKSNYTVETAVRLKEFASRSAEIDTSQLIYELCKTPDMPRISFKGRKSKEPVRDKLNKEGVFVVDIGNNEATAATLLDWMDERNEYEIENAFNVYAASTRRSAYEASLLVKFFRNMCNIMGIYSGADILDVLSARLYYGVKPDIVPMVVSIKRLGRKRARSLVKAFGEDLRYVTRDDLLKIDGIGPKTAEAILEKYSEN
jgi:helicase